MIENLRIKWITSSLIFFRSRSRSRSRLPLPSRLLIPAILANSGTSNNHPRERRTFLSIKERLISSRTATASLEEIHYSMNVLPTNGPIRFSCHAHAFTFDVNEFCGEGGQAGSRSKILDWEFGFALSRHHGNGWRAWNRAVESPW